MDDQFGGRTDDDLFADEFEPVLDDVPQPQPEAPTFAAPPVASEAPSVASPSPSTAPNSVVEAAPAKDVAPSNFTPSEPKPGSGLAQSRFAQQPPADTPRAPRSHRANQSSNKPHHNNNNNNGSSNNNSNNNQAVASPAPSSPAPHQPKPHENRHQNPKTGPGSGARAGSGANPRTKLSEAELVEKMEKMRILNAEKTERFKRAEADEHSHAIALEKASVEAKKRRQEEAERRKLEATNRRQMDDERERNRQRKLNALGVKENSWDEGKEQRLEEEDRRRGGNNFRGANGGIRGAASGRGGGGLSGSRFADATSDTDFMTGRGGSARGRGGRGGGRGRGGRGDYLGTAPPQGQSPAPAKTKEASLKTEDFPELPPSSTANKRTASVAKADLSTPTSPLGKWDDEMEALDAKAAAATES
ncbi:hypothetical protein SLS53_001657 [Cytospora paraplurivora]|uniref:Uncharacterized protein n=1 Tax=Cytospora paraplurivora TaxID=2898453 RepID=A0AAN9UIF5_9PEZI